MFEDELSGGEQAGGIFPFLSILICTMGVMVVILIGGSLKMTMTDEGEVARVNERHVTVAARLQAIEDDLANLGSEIESRATEANRAEMLASNLQAEAKELLAQTDVLNEKSAAAEREIEAIRPEAATLMAKAVVATEALGKIEALRRRRDATTELAAATTRQDASKKDLAAVESTLEELTAETEALRKRRDDLAGKTAHPDARFSFVGEGADVAPVVADLRKDSLRIVRSPLGSIHAGTEVPAAEAGAFLDKLAQDLAALSQPGDGPGHALILVRPGAVSLDREARKAFARWRAHMNHEPMEENWAPVF